MQYNAVSQRTCKAVSPTKKDSSWPAVFRAAFPHTVPIMTGYLVLSLAYGVLMRSKGYGALWSLLASLVAYCGSMQYACVALLTAAFDPVGAFFLALMVNARHAFYSFSLLNKFNAAGPYRPFLIYTLSDESFSLAATVDPPEGMDGGRFYFAMFLLDYLYWAAGSAAGGLIGNLITFDTTGMDFALTAMFVVLFLEQLRKKECRTSGVLGLVCAGLCLAVFGADGMVLPAMALILIILILGRDKLCA